MPIFGQIWNSVYRGMERLHDNSRTHLKPEQYTKSGKLGMFFLFIHSLYAGWNLLSGVRLI